MIEHLRSQVENGNYLIKPHSILHALKEGFDELDMVDAISSGRIIEEYPDDQRVKVGQL
jgi:hypothetical protein